VDDTTWSDNANAANTWTFDVSGTDHTAIFGSVITTWSGGITTTLDLIVNGLDLTLGATGVKMTSDNDGAITFLSISAGSQEDLTFNFDDVANTVGVTTSTGVTDIDFGTIEIVDDASNVADNIIDSAHYAAASVDLEHMASASVDSDNIVDNTIANADMADNSIDSDDYVDASIDTAHITDLNVTEDKLAASLAFDDGDLLDFGTFVTTATEGLMLPANATVCTSATAEGQVCWEEDAKVLWIGDGTAPVQIGGSEINDLEATDPPNVADTEVYIGTGAGTGAWSALSGDATMTNAGVVTLVHSMDQAYNDGSLITADTGTTQWTGTTADKILITLKTTDDSTTNPALAIKSNSGSNMTQLFGDGSATFNQQGAAVDFRVESDNNLNMLYVDGTNDEVGVNDGSPDFTFDVGGNGGFDGTISILEQADANADLSGRGQIWVNTAIPNEIFFTDDAGTDFNLTAGTDSNSPKLYYWPAEATLPFQPIADLATGAEDGVAPVSKDSDTNIEMLTVAFDDTADEFRAIKFMVPTDVVLGSNVTITFRGYAATAAAQDVAIIFAHYAIADAENWDGNMTEEAITTTLTNTQDAKDDFVHTETSTSLGWAAGDTVYAYIGRDGDHATDDGLSGDFLLVDISMEIPRA